MKLLKKLLSVAISCLLAAAPGYTSVVNEWKSTFGGLTQMYNYSKGMASNIYDAVGDKTTLLRAGKQWKTVYMGVDNSEITETEFQYDKNGDMLYALNNINNTRTSYAGENGLSTGKAQVDQILAADGKWYNSAMYEYNKDGSMKSKSTIGNIGKDAAGTTSADWVDINGDGKVTDDDAGYVVTQKVLFANGKQQEVRQYWGQVMKDKDGYVTTDDKKAEKDGDKVKLYWEKGSGKPVQRFLYQGNQMKAAVSLGTDGKPTGTTVYIGGKERYSLRINDGNDVSLDEEGDLTISGKKFKEEFNDGVEIRDGNGSILALVASESVYKGSKKVADVSYNVENWGDEEVNASTFITEELAEALDNLLSKGSADYDGKHEDFNEQFAGKSDEERSTMVENWGKKKLMEKFRQDNRGWYADGIADVVITPQDQKINFSDASVKKVGNKWIINGKVTSKDLNYGKRNSATYVDNHGRNSHALQYIYKGGQLTDVKLAQKWVYNDTASKAAKPGYNYDMAVVPQAVKKDDGKVVYMLSLFGTNIELPDTIDIGQGQTWNVKDYLDFIANDGTCIGVLTAFLNILSSAKTDEGTSMSLEAFLDTIEKNEYPVVKKVIENAIKDGKGNLTVNEFVKTMTISDYYSAMDKKTAEEEKSVTQKKIEAAIGDGKGDITISEFMDSVEQDSTNIKANIAGAIENYIQIELSKRSAEFKDLIGSKDSDIKFNNIHIDDTGTFQAVQFNITDNIAYTSGAMMYSVNFLDYGPDGTYASITYYNNNGQQKATYDYGGEMQTTANRRDLETADVLSAFTSLSPILENQELRYNTQNGDVTVSVTADEDFFKQLYDVLSQEQEKTDLQQQVFDEIQKNVKDNQGYYSNIFKEKYCGDTGNVFAAKVVSDPSSDLTLKLQEKAFYEQEVSVQYSFAGLNKDGDFVILAEKVY